MKLGYSEPEPWVIAINSMTHNQAIRLGKVMGDMGLTGQFLGGSLAKNMERFLKWQLEHGSEGGE